MQGSIAARITRTANVRWHVTAPTRARPRAGRRSLAGTAPRATPPSACCRTVWPRGCRANSMTSKRWWRMPSGPRAAAQRPMRCAATRWGSRARYAGSSAECCWSTTPCSSSSGCCPSSSSDASPRWARCAPGSRPTARSWRCVHSLPSNSPRYPPRWGSTPTVAARRFAICVTMADTPPTIPLSISRRATFAETRAHTKATLRVRRTARARDAQPLRGTHALGHRGADLAKRRALEALREHEPRAQRHPRAGVRRRGRGPCGDTARVGALLTRRATKQPRMAATPPIQVIARSAKRGTLGGDNTPLVGQAVPLKGRIAA